MGTVIGLDFGNFNTFPCFIQDFDPGTRMGGMVHDLLPLKSVDGIPSVYFYSKKVGRVLYGTEAVGRRAVPEQNRLRYLKRNLGKTILLDDRTVSYDRAITEVVQHCVRVANKSLEMGWQETSNMVSLSYPATYSCAQRRRLIDLVEAATLEDGQHLEVFGTIAEPAAAALDYLAEFAKGDGDTTVLTYDLGGGTFDLGLVSVYPRGRRRKDGSVYYYDVVNTGGIGDLGGAEFDKVMYQLASSKVHIALDPQTRAILQNAAETAKVELSDAEETLIQLFAPGGTVDVAVTREEFEERALPLVRRTIEATREMLNAHTNQRPDIILLTGGASQMPIVRREMERAFPEYAGRIKIYRPSRSIAYGAARYGTKEKDTDPVASEIVKHLDYDIGIRLQRIDSEERFVATYLKAGATLPCDSGYQGTITSKDLQSTSCFRVYEAIKNDPKEQNWENDYRQILSVTLSYGRKVPKGYESDVKLTVDRRGLLRIEARERENPENLVDAHVRLENLS